MAALLDASTAVRPHQLHDRLTAIGHAETALWQERLAIRAELDALPPDETERLDG